MFVLLEHLKEFGQHWE